MAQESEITLLSSTRQTDAKPLIPFAEFSSFFGIAAVLALGIEPGARVSPRALRSCQRDLEHPSDLGHGQAGGEDVIMRADRHEQVKDRFEESGVLPAGNLLDPCPVRRWQRKVRRHEIVEGPCIPTSLIADSKDSR
jgi:hypothetical protein